MKTIYQLICLLALLCSCSSAHAKGPWVLSDDKTNYLLADDVAKTAGLNGLIKGRKRFWVKDWAKPSQVFEWSVKADEKSKCQVSLLVKVPVAGTVMTLESESDKALFTAKEMGWQRIDAELEVGTTDLLKLSLKDGISGKLTAEVIGVEIITGKYAPLYAKRIKEMRTPIEDAAWFSNSGFGIMFQWGNWGYPRTGKRKAPWNRVYEDFDIEAFADKMESFNPGYIIWSITWRGSRFSAPLKSVDEVMGNSEYTMEYDFMGKLVDALTSRNIPVFFYYHPGAEERGYWDKVWKGYDDVTTWENANVKIWTEISQRLGDKLSGWFVDDGMVQYYPADFYRYAKALKAGNPKRLITFNPWIAPNVSPFDDVSMGEGHAPGEKANGVFTSGPTKGILTHTMKCMDSRGWGVYKKNDKIQDPRGGLEIWQQQVDQAKSNKHPISLCIGMYEDGSLNPISEKILSQLKR